MRVLVQRVKRSSVTIDGVIVGEIGKGLLLLLGIHVNDTSKEVDWLVRKCASLRVFADDNGVMNKSVTDVSGDVMVVSQFTLYGDSRKGNRPSFIEAARPETAEPLYEEFVAKMSTAIERDVPTGRFGAEMDVQLINDGPVTIWLERPPTGLSKDAAGNQS